MSRKWILPSIGAAVLIAAIAVGAVFLSKRGFIVPEDFAGARTRGAEIASFLNDFSDRSIKTIEEIERKDKEGNYGEALDQTVKELEKVNQAREKSLELLGELQKMASALPLIPDSDAQAIGVQAISTEIALVEKLLDYNEKLKKLLDILRMKFTSRTPESFDLQMSETAKAINEDILAINEFNRKYQSLMGEFDGKAGKK